MTKEKYMALADFQTLWTSSVKPWINGVYATKNELAQAAVIPVNLEDMTPMTKFVKNNVLAINGVQYRATKNTTHFPVTLVTDGGQFVVNVVNGAPAYVVDNYTLDPDWEIWGDAGIPQTLANMQADFNEALQQSLNTSTRIKTSDGQTQYTVQQLLTAMADLMGHTVVVNSSKD